MEHAVANWINEHFDTSAINVKTFPILPAGRLLVDADGATILVWWDILLENVRYEIK